MHAGYKTDTPRDHRGNSHILLEVTNQGTHQSESITSMIRIQECGKSFSLSVRLSFSLTCPPLSLSFYFFLSPALLAGDVAKHSLMFPLNDRMKENKVEVYLASRVVFLSDSQSLFKPIGWLKGIYQDTFDPVHYSTVACQLP